MDSLIGVIAVLIGLLAAAGGVYRLMGSSEALKRFKLDSEATHGTALAEVKQWREAKDNMQRKLDERVAAEREMAEKSKEILGLLSPEEREKRPPIYILSDRRNKGDFEFRVDVINAKLGGTWARGREYALWAKDEENARRAVDARFPASAGYVSEGLKRSKEPL